MDLAELLGHPVDHPEGPLLYTGLAHGDSERRDSPVRGDLVVRTGQEEAPLGFVGVARPDLLAGDDELVTLPIGPCAQRGKVRTGVGLAEALAPAVSPVDNAREEASC